MKHITLLHRYLLLGLWATSLFYSPSLMAAPGTIADEPLYTTSAADPNIMFMVDTSGSMNNIVPESPYDALITYDPDTGAAGTVCPSPQSSTANIDLSISGGVPSVNVGGTIRPLGSDAATQYCFDPTVTYTNAQVHTNGGLSGQYTGNYLNWYFYDIPPAGGWSDRKPGTTSRIETVQNVMGPLLTSLQGTVRAGITTFNGNDGSTLGLGTSSSVLINDLDATQQTAMTGAIPSSGGGNTPLAETLRDIGRYYANDSSGVCGGSASAQLTLHPNDASPTPEDCTTVLASSRVNKTAGPVQFWCQKNFAVLMTDGQATEDQNEISGTSLADYDGDCVSASPACNTFDRKSGVTYQGSEPSDYWDDVAQALFEMDLRPDLLDNNGNAVTNNVTSYTIGFADEQVRNHPLIRQTAAQGGGEFIFAENADDLQQAFASATQSILAQTSTAAAVTFNTSTLSSDSAVYQALFNTSRWGGELRSYPLDGVTGQVQTGCTLNTSHCWSAASQLDAQVEDALNNFTDTRTILSYNTSSDLGIPFKTPTDYTTLGTEDLSQAHIDDLCAGPDVPFACTSVTASEITANQAYLGQLVNYFRGDRTQEGSSTAPNFRIRTNVLGDIVNANPVFVGKPQLNWPSIEDPSNFFGATGERYSDFKTGAAATRMNVVYAAANDGMLHGFRTEDDSATITVFEGGQEVLAYTPSYLQSATNTAGLHYLADPNYSHKYYVDLSPAISDVYIKYRDSSGTATLSEDWRTILIGGGRAGGRGLFALDITDPSNYAEANAKQLVQWEFSNTDDPDLGFSFSKPTIALTNAEDASGNKRWAAVFGNGYNSGLDGGAGSCSAKLFIVFLDGGLDGAWTTNTSYSLTDYIPLDTKVGSTSPTTNCNGLSTPSLVDLNGDGTVDRVYAGDLKGNMWVFDLCNKSGTSCQSSGWGVAYNTGPNPKPLFTAKDAGGTVQPITVQPILSSHPTETNTTPSNEPNILVLFGTGQYLTSADKATSTDIQSFYTVWDHGKQDLVRSGLVQQTLSTVPCGTDTCRVVTNNSITYSNTVHGWFIDLTTDERVVVNPKVRNNILFFNTLIPDNATCGFGGTGWLMSIDVTTGGPPADSVFDVNNDGVIDNQDVVNDGGVNKVATGQYVKGGIPAESTFLGDKQYTPDSSGGINMRDVDTGPKIEEGRKSWRELRQ